MELEYIDPKLHDPALRFRLPKDVNDVEYLFAKEIIETDGFAVEHFPSDDPDCVGGLTALTFMDDHAFEAANFAGTDLKLVKVVRGNVLPEVFEALYSLTLECSDGCFYEAKVDMPGDYDLQACKVLPKVIE